MRILLLVLAPAWATGCAIEYCVGDSREISNAERVRGTIATPVEVEFRAEYDYGVERPPPPPLFGAEGISYRIRVRYEENRRDVFAYLDSSGAFGALDRDVVSGPRAARFGRFEEEAVLRVRLTLSMDDRWQQASDWILFLSLSMIPTWKTVRRDLVAEVWDSSGKELMFEVYEERHRRIRWAPLAVTWPFQLIAPPARRGRIRRQVDHFLIDLRNVMDQAGAESFAEQSA